MNVSNLANLFHQNNIFQQSKPLGQKLVQLPVNDTLQRLSENLLTAQEKGQDSLQIVLQSGGWYAA